MDTVEAKFKAEAEAETKAAVEAKLKAETEVKAAITVVIPYVKKHAHGEELKYAIASWLKFFHHPFNIVIIGDGEEEASLKNKEDGQAPITLITHACTSDNPQVDLIEKLKLAIAVPEVSDRFIFAADDIYLVSPVMLADIEMLKIKGITNEKSYTGIKAENYKRTAELLGMSSYPCHEAHLPVLFEKEKLIELLETYPQLNEGGYFFTSVYFYHFFREFVPVQLQWNSDIYLLPVHSRQPDEKAFRVILQQKKFLTTAKEGFSKWLKNQLAYLYGRKEWIQK